MSEKYKGLHALVVDDIEVNRFIIRQQLSALGFSLHEAADGKDAVERVVKHEYHLILMDLQMPVMNGLAATEGRPYCPHHCYHSP